MNNAATVLTELSEKIKTSKLLSLAKAEKEFATIQRLGFILEHIGKKELAKPLSEWLKDQKPSLISLRPDLPIKDGCLQLMAQWKLIYDSRSIYY